MLEHKFTSQTVEKKSKHTGKGHELLLKEGESAETSNQGKKNPQDSILAYRVSPKLLYIASDYVETG